MPPGGCFFHQRTKLALNSASTSLIKEAKSIFGQGGQINRCREQLEQLLNGPLSEN